MTQLDDEATEGDQGGPHPAMIITEPEPYLAAILLLPLPAPTFGLPLLHINATISSGQLAIPSSTAGVPEDLPLYLLESH